MRSLALSLALTACAETDGPATIDGTGTTGTLDPFERFINVPADTLITGDMSTFTAGADWASTTWWTQAIDGSQVVHLPLAGLVMDFESDNPVDAATVTLWDDDLVDSTPDRTAQSALDGSVHSEATTCSPLTYKVSTDPILAETKTTFEAHRIYPPAADMITEAEFTSVSSTTYQLIPSILGVSVDPDLAIIAGTAYDVLRDAGLPSDDPVGKIEGAQVVVYDENGEIPDTLVVNYFVSDFPNRDQKWTSADGLWVASNVPPGTLRVELWGNTAAGLSLLGATVVHSEADSINISNIYAGYGDGVKYPGTCEATP